MSERGWRVGLDESVAPGLSGATEERGSAAREAAASLGAPERAGDTA
jgi:hypothetical protein